MMRSQLKQECETAGGQNPDAGVTELTPEITACKDKVDSNKLRLFFSDQYLAEGELSNEEYLIQKYADHERKELLAQGKIELFTKQAGQCTGRNNRVSEGDPCGNIDGKCHSETPGGLPMCCGSAV